MKVIKPTTFVEATHLVSSNAVELYAAYNAGTTYAKSDRVDYGTYSYESLVNNNLGNQPNTSPTFWVLVGPDNIHAMFDAQVSTTTVSSTPLIVVMTPGLINSVALLGLVGAQASIVITNGAGGPTIYSHNANLDGSYVYDWYMYFFEPFTQIGEVVLTDIPPYSNARMTLTLSGSGSVAIGQLSFGTFYELGDAEYGATAGIIDYSRKDTNEFGETAFVKRAFSKRMTARLMLDAVQMNKVQRVLSDIRATPAVWIGADGETYIPLVVFGFYRDFTIDVAYPTKSYCSLEIEGLI